MRTKSAILTHVAAVVLLGAAVYLPNLGQEVSLKKNEARHAEIAATMLRFSEYVVPYTCGAPYIDKPPLYNWAVAAVYAITGREDLAGARLVSALAAIWSAILVYLLGRRWLSARAGILGAVMWITSWMTIEWARFARMDMMMAALVLSAAYVTDLAAVANGRRPRVLWLSAWLVAGLAALSKNFSALVFFIPAAAAIWKARQGRWAPPWRMALAGIVMSLIPYAVWLAAAELLRPGQIHDMFSYQVGIGLDEHPGGWTLYLLGLGAQTLPWTAFVGGALYWSYRHIRAKGFDTAVIAAFVSVACLAVMSAIPTKRPHYILPMVPFWTLWLGGLVDRGLTLRQDARSGDVRSDVDVRYWGFELPLGGALIGVFIFFGGFAVYYAKNAVANRAAGTAILAVAAALAGAGTVALFGKRLKAAVVFLMASFTAVAVAGYPVFLRGMNEPAPEYAAAEAIARTIGTDAPVADYNVRDELICLDLHREVAFPDGEESLRAFVNGGGLRYVLVRVDKADEVMALSPQSVRVVMSYELDALNCALLEIGGATPAAEPLARPDGAPGTGMF